MVITWVSKHVSNVKSSFVEQKKSGICRAFSLGLRCKIVIVKFEDDVTDHQGLAKFVSVLEYK